MLKLYNIKINNQLDNETPMSWQNIILGCILGVISVPITWWVIQFFLPIFSDISILLALLHGCLLSAPIIFRRKKIVL
jgi:xanthine/uracil permease